MERGPGKVVRILSRTEVVVNLGSLDGIHEGQYVLIYRLDSDIVDPESGENLGKLEIVLGKGIAKHVQERLTTVRSREKRTIRMGKTLGLWDSEERDEMVPFGDVAVGDLVRTL